MEGNKNLRSQHTDIAAQKMPEWMKANRDEDSNFQKFLNHAVMLKIDDYTQEIYDTENNSFLDTANEDMIYTTFRMHKNQLPEDLLENSINNLIFNAQGRIIEVTTSLNTFLKNYNKPKDYCYFNEETNFLHFTYPYKYADIELEKHHVWNPFDEEALLHNLKRLPDEDNKTLKERVKHKSKHPSNSTKEGLKNHIARELGIQADNVSFDSVDNQNYINENIVLNTVSDDSYIKSLTNPNGTATDKLKGIAKSINKKLNIFWGDTIWDESYWGVSQNNTYRAIPYQIDK